jgi:hypothetical protein
MAVRIQHLVAAAIRDTKLSELSVMPGSVQSLGVAADPWMS